MSESADDRAIRPEETPFSREVLAAFEAVERRAFANYVFELLKGCAEERALAPTEVRARRLLRRARGQA
jgi:hypothetical protein